MNNAEPNLQTPVVTEPPRRSPWSAKARILRTLWGLVEAVFWRHSPVWAWGFRRFILRSFGAKVGLNVRVHPSVRVIIPWNLDLQDRVLIHERAILYALGEVRIGARSEVGPLAHICAGTHDFTDPAFSLLRTPIMIGSDCVLGIASFVGPGVTLADRTVLMPRTAIYTDSREDARYQGNPAKEIVESLKPEGAAR